MIPQVTFSFVDVRDVAEAHVRCLTTQEATGKLCTGRGGVRVPLPSKSGLYTRNRNASLCLSLSVCVCLSLSLSLYISSKEEGKGKSNQLMAVLDNARNRFNGDTMI